MRVVPLPYWWPALVIAEVGDPGAWLSEDELAVAASFAREKRRSEWVLSRVAEKELRRRGARGPCASYSHRGPYGAAMVGESPVGIDVELVRALRPQSAHLFLSDGETADAQRCAIDHALLHFWCAKEAAWKQRGGATPTLKRVPLRLEREHARGLVFDLAETWAVDDVIVAVTRPTS